MSIEPDESLKLFNREGLPDALRILYEKFPRENWDAHDNFHGLVQFWLERHLMFRRLLDIMSEDIQAVADKMMDPKQYLHRLSRYGQIFVHQLHEHHMIEDHHFFPRMIKAESTLERGIDLLENDHQHIDAHLGAFAETVNKVLQQTQDDAIVEAAKSQLELTVTTSQFLDRHLTDEEDLIVPIILKHGEGSFN